MHGFIRFSPLKLLKLSLACAEPGIGPVLGMARALTQESNLDSGPRWSRSDRNKRGHLSVGRSVSYPRCHQESFIFGSSYAWRRRGFGVPFARSNPPFKVPGPWRRRGLSAGDQAPPARSRGQRSSQRPLPGAAGWRVPRLGCAVVPGGRKVRWKSPAGNYVW